LDNNKNYGKRGGRIIQKPTDILRLNNLYELQRTIEEEEEARSLFSKLLPNHNTSSKKKH
jgi:hypothetical protein